MTQQDQAYPTRRTATRAPLGKPVQLHFDDTDEILDANCHNISIGGMFVELEDPRPAGTLVRFELPVEGGSICGLGEVAWMRAEAVGPDREAGMGIKFRHLEHRDRQLIFKLVSEHIKERLARRPAPGSPQVAPSPPRSSSSVTPPASSRSPASPPASRAIADDAGRPAERPSRREVPRSASRQPFPNDELAALEAASARRAPRSEAPALDELEPPLDEMPVEFLGELEVPEPEDPSLDEPPVDETVASEGWPHVEGETGEFDPASRPAPKRDFPLFPVLALLLLLLSAGAYLLRGSLADRPAAPGVETEVVPAEPTESQAGDRDGTAEPAAGPPPATRPEPEKELDAVPPFPPVAPPRITTPNEPRPSAFFSRVLDISWTPDAGGGVLVVSADGQIPTARYRSFRLGDGGPREVVQLIGVRESFPKKTIAVGGPVVTQIRTGYHQKTGGNELHVVIDLAAARYRVRNIANRGTKLEIEIR